ncbi:MAG: SpoIID/LytB domain-containing protein [bacterium]
MKLYRIYSVIIFIIVAFFYCFPAFAIKIGLFTNINSVVVATSKPGIFINSHTEKSVLNLEPLQPYLIKINGNGLSVTFKKKSYDLQSNYIIVKSEESGFVFTKNKWYRGNLIIFNSGNKLTVINDIDLESYIMGVIPAEMPSSWNIEAHKAQAIAARSYAVANMGKRAKNGYDLKDTPEDQAYGGASCETLKTNTAAIQTKGQVLVCENKVVPAYYHSSSGGHTVNSGAVWVKDLPFVRAVPSFDDNLPKRGHGVGMSQHGANVLANYGYNAYQILGYFYQNINLYTLNY